MNPSAWKSITSSKGAARVEELLAAPDRLPTPERICRFNGLVLAGLEVDEDTRPGEVRRHSVGVAGYPGAPAEDCPELLARLCDWLNGPDFRPTDRSMTFALLLFKAVLAHLDIAWIHPFGDGNGRTARLAEFQWLVQSGLVPNPNSWSTSECDFGVRKSCQYNPPQQNK